MKPDSIAELRGHEIGGWISPDGLFFQVQEGGHSSMARKIVDGLGDKVYYESNYLIERGWIRLETDGRVLHAYQATGQQFDILYRLYTQALPGWYKDIMYRHIVPMVARVREPMPQVPGQGDQENYRHSYS